MSEELRDIQVGDRYVRGDRYIEVTCVTATHVGYVLKGGMGSHEPVLTTVEEFKRLEANTMANGCEFVPVEALKRNLPPPRGKTPGSES